MDGTSPVWMCTMNRFVKYTIGEEEKILRVASPFLRALVVLILETGIRHGEALSLKWDAVDFANGLIRVRESKTRAGIRNVPLTTRCTSELLRWREIAGPSFSAFVFPNFNNPEHPRRDVRFAWSKTLKQAGLLEFPLYFCRPGRHM